MTQAPEPSQSVDCARLELAADAPWILPDGRFDQRWIRIGGLALTQMASSPRRLEDGSSGDFGHPLDDVSVACRCDALWAELGPAERGWARRLAGFDPDLARRFIFAGAPFGLLPEAAPWRQGARRNALESILFQPLPAGARGPASVGSAIAAAAAPAPSRFAHASDDAKVQARLARAVGVPAALPIAFAMASVIGGKLLPAIPSAALYGVFAAYAMAHVAVYNRALSGSSGRLGPIPFFSALSRRAMAKSLDPVDRKALRDEALAALFPGEAKAERALRSQLRKLWDPLCLEPALASIGPAPDWLAPLLGRAERSALGEGALEAHEARLIARAMAAPAAATAQAPAPRPRPRL